MKIPPEKYWELRYKEEDLISQRLSWLLTSQIVLFAAYGIIIKDDGAPGHARRLTFVIEGLGITIACLILIGIIAAILASILLYRKVNNPIENPSNEKQTLGVHPVLTIIGWFVAAFIPVIFVVAWFMLL